MREEMMLLTNSKTNSRRVKILPWLSSMLMIAMTSSSFVPSAQAASTEASPNNFQQFFNSNSASALRTSSRDMQSAEVSQQFDCPLFSNSPYGDILKSINSLENAVRLSDSCKQDSGIKDALSIGKDLKDRVTAVKQVFESGKGVPSAQNLEEILGQSAQFQEMLINMAQNAQPCYKDNNNRNIIFKINDALQSIAPLALDIVTKMPAVNSALLPVVAGSGALVQSISTLEKVMSESATLDMSNTAKGSENRLALIKNTCQFMKVYNKVDYLQMNRAERARRIQSDYQNQLRPVEESKSSLLDILNNNQQSATPESKAVAAIKTANSKMKKSVEGAQVELASSSSDVGICTTVKTLATFAHSGNLLANYQKIVKITGEGDVSNFKINKYNEFLSRLSQNQRDAQACAAVTKDWMAAVVDIVSDTEKMVTAYEKSHSGSLVYILAADGLDAQVAKAKDIQENRKKLEKFTEISLFEPSEITKRIRTMPRYLFAGPDGGLNSYVPDGSWKKFLFNNGPVFAFLKNNEAEFVDIMKVFNKNFDAIMKAEEARIHKIVPYLNRNSDIQKIYELRAAARLNLPTLNRGTYPIGSREHRAICDNTKMALRSFQDAKDMLASSHYMCQLIDPVLKEDGVSIPLKSYCRGSSGYQSFVEDLQQQKLNQIVEKIWERQDTLECE